MYAAIAYRSFSPPRDASVVLDGPVCPPPPFTVLKLRYDAGLALGSVAIPLPVY